MSNLNQYIPGEPADFKKFLATQKGVFSKEICAEFEAFREQHEAFAREQAKFFRPEAERRAKEIRERFESNPTPENARELSENSPEDVRRKYEYTANVIAARISHLCEKRKPLAAAILGTVLPLVDSEIARVEDEGRATAARYGVEYVADEDRTVLALRKWRQMAVNRAGSGRAMQPANIVETFGEIRHKRGGILG